MISGTEPSYFRLSSMYLNVPTELVWCGGIRRRVL
jgi:hypothetical protein